MRATRLTFPSAMLAVAGLARLSGAAQARERPAPKRPNVVVIMSDDQDFRSMGVMPKTRRLIARRGTTFATASVSFPLCCPSRATYHSGQYPHNHDVRWNTFPEGGYYKFNGRETLPVWLRRAGYRTIHIGKYLNQYGERNPREVPRGWSDWHGGVDPTTYDYYGFTLNHNGRLKTYPRRPRYYSTDVYAGLAEKAIRDARRARKPFFLNVAPNAPHTVSVKSRASIEGTPALAPPRYARRFAATPLPRYPNFDEADVSDQPPFLGAIWPRLTGDQIASLTAHYRGRIGALLGVDDLVGRVVEALKRNRVYGNTDIIFTSDNGWILGEHRLTDPQSEDGKASGVKFFPFEGSSRVPLMAAGPDFPAHRTVKGPVVNADLAPTIEDITGAHAGLPQDGVSLVAAARKPARLNGRGILLETFQNPRGAPPYQSIRTRRYRYDMYKNGQQALYDLKRDPWELRSVQADPRYARVKAACGPARPRAPHAPSGERRAPPAHHGPQPPGAPSRPAGARGAKCDRRARPAAHHRANHRNVRHRPRQRPPPLRGSPERSAHSCGSRPATRCQRSSCPRRRSARREPIRSRRRARGSA